MSLDVYEIITTNDGFMVANEETGDYLHDRNGDNCFDLLIDATFLMRNQMKKDLLTQLGYVVKEDVDQPGLWVWMSSMDGCDSSLKSEQAAYDDAWFNVSSNVMGLANLSSDQWDQMSFEDKIQLALQHNKGDGDHD